MLSRVLYISFESEQHHRERGTLQHTKTEAQGEKKSPQITEPVNRLTWFERWTDFILTESWRLLDSFIILTPGKHLRSQHKWPGWGRGALGQNDVVVKGEREKEEDS